MSDDEQKPQWGCAAYGCPLHGSIRDGSDWMCFVHFQSDVGQWQEISARLNQRREIVRYYQHGLRMDPVAWAAGRCERAGEAMIRIGRSDLVPREVELQHTLRDKLTGEPIIHTVKRDERDSIALWVSRLAGVLSKECKGDSKPKAPAAQAAGAETWANAAGLVTAGLRHGDGL